MSPLAVAKENTVKPLNGGKKSKDERRDESMFMRRKEEMRHWMTRFQLEEANVSIQLKGAFPLLSK